MWWDLFLDQDNNHTHTEKMSSTKACEAEALTRFRAKRYNYWIDTKTYMVKLNIPK